MSSVNKVILVGRLGKDPALKTTSGGKQVCTFSLATSQKWTKDEVSHEDTQWHQVVAWGNLAKNCATYLKKGRMAYVEGSLRTRTWEKEGQKHYTTEVFALQVQFLGGKLETDDE